MRGCAPVDGDRHLQRSLHQPRQTRSDLEGIRVNQKPTPMQIGGGQTIQEDTTTVQLNRDIEIDLRDWVFCEGD